ncbi:MAG: DnaJ domain-containing protein [bacterium]
MEKSPISNNQTEQKKLGLKDFEKMDNWQRLGIVKGASPEEIKKAYRRTMLFYNPDKVDHQNREGSEIARLIIEAYEALQKEKIFFQKALWKRLFLKWQEI